MMTIQPWPTTQQSRHDQIKSLRPPPIQESHPGMKPQHWGCRQKFLKKSNQIESPFCLLFFTLATCTGFLTQLRFQEQVGWGTLLGSWDLVCLWFSVDSIEICLKTCWKKNR